MTIVSSLCLCQSFFKANDCTHGFFNRWVKNTMECLVGVLFNIFHFLTRLRVTKDPVSFIYLFSGNVYFLKDFTYS